jgi:Family of unknown function (DUF6011)
MSFNPSSFRPVAAILRPTAPTPTGAIPMVASTVTAVALREAGNRWLKRHDQFADGKADTCFDMADKLDRFGSFVSEKQEGYARKLIEWSLPRQQQPDQGNARTSQAAELVRANPTLPKLFALMQRLAKLRFGDVEIARKNGDSLCWIKVPGVEKVAGRLTDGGTLTIWQRPMVDLQDLTRRLLEIEADPERAAVLYGKASGNCSICGRDLTDPESIERGIGPICAGKYFG